MITMAAPNPLSIFTTLTPDAQLVSNPEEGGQSAEPTEVGTATTGMATRPPTTLGSAPSIPATTIAARALRTTSRLASSRCNPCDADVEDADTLGMPAMRRVRGASSATGISLVPAVTTATGGRLGPRPGRCIRLAVRPDERKLRERRGSAASTTLAASALSRVMRTFSPASSSLPRDADDLLGGLARAENHLREALTEGAVVVDAKAKPRSANGRRFEVL